MYVSVLTLVHDLGWGLVVMGDFVTGGAVSFPKCNGVSFSKVV